MGKIGDRLRRRYEEKRGGAPATKDDLSRLRREMDSGLRKIEPGRQSGPQIASRAVKMAGRGIKNVGASLGTPYDARRPKISQLPRRRRDIGISTSADLDFLKMPGLRGQNISGKGGKAKKRRL